MIQRASASGSALLLALALSLATGCAPEPGEEAEAGMEDTAAAPAAAPETVPPAAAVTGDTVRADMRAMNRSGVTGSLGLSAAGDSLAVTVRLGGVEAGQAYASHIHQGTCASPGSVAIPLSDVSGDSGTARTTVDVSGLAAGQSYLVMAHAPGGQPIACGELPANWQSLLFQG